MILTPPIRRTHRILQDLDLSHLKVPRLNGPTRQSVSSEPIAIRLDARVYNLDTAQRAAFRCTDLASFEFTLLEDNEIVVTAIAKPGLQIDPVELRARYQNELLDQQLRRTVAEETKNERDLILAYAFSNTKLLG